MANRRGSAAAVDVSPARRCAFAVVRRVFEQGAYADRALFGEAVGLDPRERAFATALVYGTVQRQGTLDGLARGWVDRPLARLEPAVLTGLRLGLFQVLFMGGVADHAAVSQTVELVRPLSRGGAGLLNAVLRRATREGAARLAELRDEDPAGAAAMHSVPEWLAEMWFRELGASDARELLRRVNEPAEAALRVNALRASVDDVVSALPVAARSAPGLEEGLVLSGPFDAFGSPLWEAGAIMPQSRGSMLVSRALAPDAGAEVLDLCAAPGGKTTHLAALGAGRVVAVERHAGRAEALRATCARMGADDVGVETVDARALPPTFDDQFGAVLVDPPCSGLGTVQSRPDLRWRASAASVTELSVVQRSILAAGARAVRPGGVLVYSVCTISRSEGADVVEALLASHPEFRAEDLSQRLPAYATAACGPYLQLLPHREGTDGFFIARLRRGAR